MNTTVAFLVLCLLIGQLASSSESKEDSDSEVVDKQYFLDELLTQYGDGTHISVEQIQALLDSIQKPVDPEHKHKKDMDPEIATDGDAKSETVIANNSCLYDEHWLQRKECLDVMCLSAEKILEFHSVSGNMINGSILRQISPTLLYSAQNTDCQEAEVLTIPPKTAEVWGYSFLCVTVINLCSLMGMVFLPLMHKPFYKKLLMFMVALAVGTLSGSALLFLIPECFEFASEDNPLFDDYVWRCTTVLGGIYLFFLVERILKNIMDWRKKMVKFDSDDSSMDHVSEEKYYEPLHKHNEDQSHLENAPISSLKTRSIHREKSCNMSFTVPQSPRRKSIPNVPTSSRNLVGNESDTTMGEAKDSVVKFDLGPDARCGETSKSETKFQSLSPRTLQQIPEVRVMNDDHHSAREEHVNYGMTRSPDSTTSFASLRPNSSTAQLLNKGPECLEGNSTPSESVSSDGEIRSVAWMVIFGDGLHNFIDGLSIGAAFSKNIMAGVSVSLAVVCEELPHELGDFAILLDSGMSIRQAMTYNFLSACMCYLGLMIGILVGEMTTGSTWIFALAAGMFLYISLVDMLPEVNHASEEETKATGQPWRVFFLQNAGLLTGYGIMLFLAIFSEKIDFGTGY